MKPLPIQAIKKSSRRPKIFSQHKNLGLTAFQSRVYEVVRKIPKGRVATYEDIARALRKPRAARAVGNALNRNVFSNVPCHRVVRSNGDIGGYAWGSPDKAAILRREGIKIDNNRIDLRIYARGSSPSIGEGRRGRNLNRGNYLP